LLKFLILNIFIILKFYRPRNRPRFGFEISPITRSNVEVIWDMLSVIANTDSLSPWSPN